MIMPHLMNCGHSPDGWCLACVKELHGENEQMSAIIAKLPTYADTGARFVPGVDEAWIIVVGDDDGPFMWQDWPRYTDKWEPMDERDRDYWTGKFYSTEAAAERAAKEAKL